MNFLDFYITWVNKKIRIIEASEYPVHEVLKETWSWCSKYQNWKSLDVVFLLFECNEISYLNKSKVEKVKSQLIDLIFCPELVVN